MSLADSGIQRVLQVTIGLAAVLVFTQLLVGGRSENAFEAEVGQQTDVSFFYLSHGYAVFDPSSKIKSLPGLAK